MIEGYPEIDLLLDALEMFENAEEGKGRELFCMCHVFRLLTGFAFKEAAIKAHLPVLYSLRPKIYAIPDAFWFGISEYKPRIEIIKKAIRIIEGE